MLSHPKPTPTREAHGEAFLPGGASPEFERFLSSATRRQPGPISLKDWRDLAEAWLIAWTLTSCHGNRSAAARKLGIGRRTLYAKMEKLGLPTHQGLP